MTLAQDLVQAAAEAIDTAAMGALDSERGLALDRWAASAVVTVLRRLVEEECDWREDELASLADEIATQGALTDAPSDQAR